MGSFFGLEIALRGLRAHQAGLNVTNHNIANANTDGFSRQAVDLVTTPPYTVPAFNRDAQAGQVGTGVAASGIRRSRDGLLDLHYRAQLGSQNRAQAMLSTIEEIEAVLNEPSSAGLAQLLSDFFASWQELSNHPDNLAVREVLLQQSVALAAAFSRAAQQLTAVAKNLDDAIGAGVDESNQLADRIASLNRQIAQAEVLGQRANDLRDQRDLLLDRLAELADVSTAEGLDGSMTVLIGGRAYVQDSTVDYLAATATGPGGAMEVRFGSDNALANVSSGQLRGLMDSRQQTVPRYLDGLNQVASDLAIGVNNLHAAGYALDGSTGRQFFSGTDAATLAVDAAIIADSRLVAAADAPGQSGNNAIALAIAALRESLSPGPEEAYRSLVAALGAEVQATRGAAADAQGLVQLLQRKREEISGVSLDEEAVNLLRYQRAYEAAARVITAVDQMLDKLINETGVVGR